MSDYTVSVTFGTVSLGGGMTAAQVRDALESLPEGSRLNADYIDGLGTASVNVGDIINDVVSALEALTGENKLSATALKNLTKANISHLSKGLNFLASGNVWSGTFQTANPSASIQQFDFFIASGINTATNGETVEDKDWCISLVDNPGFDFTNTAKWLILKVSKIPTKDLPFRKMSEVTVGSGIIPYDATVYGSLALSPYSLAMGKNCIVAPGGEGGIATGIGSVASREGARAFASGYFSNYGEAQVQEYMMRLETTNAVPTEMILPGPFVLQAGKTYDINVRLVARDESGLINKSWEWKALVGSSDETDSSVATSNPVILSSGTNSMAASLSFSSGSSRRMIIECTGLNQKLRWVAIINSLEIYNHASGSGVNMEEVSGLPDPLTYVN